MKPACHNRKPFTDPNAGWVRTDRQKVDWTLRSTFMYPTIKPILRYRHPWFTDRCTVHDKADIGPGQTYAQHYGWEEHCKTCRWYPKERA